jgi:hypothetical protein
MAPAQRVERELCSFVPEAENEREPRGLSWLPSEDRHMTWFE